MVTLEELKAHLRIEQDDEDAHLTLLLSSAMAAAEDFCMRSFARQSTGSSSDEPIPDAVRLAVLLHAGHFYANRENNDPGAYRAMAQAFQSLLWPYRDTQKLV